MGYKCDFCGEQRSIVYCRSDAASLCLPCDRNVHSANALSRRHSRTLICERCNLQPAFVRCIEEKTSLCPNCDWLGHGNSSTGSMHKRQAVSCYSGCPSASELSTIWSFFLELPSFGDSNCKMVMGSMSISECPRDSQGAQGKNVQDASVTVRVTNFENVDKSTAWTGSSMLPHDTKLQNIELSSGLTYATSPKGSSHGHANAFQQACSTVASADSVMSCKTEPNICFAQQTQSNLPFSGLTGERSAGDYQDCGASSLLLICEPPWCPPFPESSLPSNSRSNAVMRYKEKKKARKFEKKVRYASRKARADVRKRVKGCFVKVGDAYENDSVTQTRSS